MAVPLKGYISMLKAILLFLKGCSMKSSIFSSFSIIGSLNLCIHKVMGSVGSVDCTLF